MKQQLQGCSRWSLLLLVFILIGTGCNTGPVETVPTPTPNPQAFLTALQITVERVRGDQHDQIPQDAPPVDVRVADEISVNEQGRGLLRFPDDLLVEIFRDTALRLDDARLDPGDTIFVRLRQIAGHILVDLNEERDNRLTLETEHAVIRSLGNQFLVCQSPELTCMVALTGEVEVEAQGQVVTVRGGEATYILKGEPPRPALCANLEDVRQWLDQKRSAGEIPPLGALVIDWPQEPCPIASLPPEPADSPTLVPTAMPEPVASPTAIPTPVPEPAVEPTSVPTPVPEPTVIAPLPSGSPPQCMVVTHVLNLRYGPGIGYAPPIDILYTGMYLDPLARSVNGRWVQVRVRESGQIGWVSARPVYVSCNVSVADLPVSQ